MRFVQAFHLALHFPNSNQLFVYHTLPNVKSPLLLPLNLIPSPSPSPLSTDSRCADVVNPPAFSSRGGSRNRRRNRLSYPPTSLLYIQSPRDSTVAHVLYLSGLSNTLIQPTSLVVSVNSTSVVTLERGLDTLWKPSFPGHWTILSDIFASFRVAFRIPVTA